MVDRARSNAVILRRPETVGLTMFALGFGLVPLRRKIRKETSIDNKGKPGGVTNGPSECFCFQRRALRPREVRRIPAAFVAERGLSRAVKTNGAARKAN